MWGNLVIIIKNRERVGTIDISMSCQMDVGFVFFSPHFKIQLNSDDDVSNLFGIH